MPNETPPAAELFEPLRGLPCWGVTYLYGTTVVLQFGEPHLQIGRIVNRKRVSYRHRRVRVKGQWELNLSECGWQILVDGEELAHSESEHEEIRRACANLDGQAFQAVSIHPPTGRARFHFDLGGLVETLPYEQEEGGDPETQWSLIQPNGLWYTYRSDGMARYHRGDAKAGEGPCFLAR